MPDVEWIGRLAPVRSDAPLPSRKLIETMSWRIASTLARRHPERLRLVETHPGGGTYDCLSLYERVDHDHGDLYLNRGGSATVLRMFDGTSGPGHMSQWRTIWAEAAVADDLRLVVKELERLCGLPSVRKLPMSTAEVLTFRLVSAFLTANAFSSAEWECRMGYADTSGPLGSGVRREFFEPFPELRKRFSIQEPKDFLDEPAYRFWFLLRDSEPQVGFEAITGLVETVEGDSYDLMSIYKSSGRRIWPLVMKVAGNLLP